MASVVTSSSPATSGELSAPSGIREDPSSAGHTTISFGKHKGRCLGSLPGSYLAWMISNLHDGQWGDLAQQVLNERKATRTVHPDKIASLLRQCGNAKALADGKSIHARIAATGQDRETFLGNLLVQMYGKCGSIRDARGVFDRICQKNVYSWSMMIVVYVRNRQARKAIKLYQRMCSEGVQPDAFTYSSVLGAAAILRDLAEGKLMHSQIVATGFEADEVVQNELINMYLNCGCLDDARSVFDKKAWRHLISWNTMIAAYAQHGHPEEALELYHRMDAEGVEPDMFTFSSVLVACSSLGDLAEGKRIHQRIASSASDMGVIVQNALVNMYSKCGHLQDAWSVFEGMQLKDVVSWNVIIAACAHHKREWDAMLLYRRMDLEGVEPNMFTFSSLLGVCSSLKALQEGKAIHARLVASGFESAVVDTTLLDMYAKCGSLNDAREIFDKMRERDVISWNAMISAYAQKGHSEQALQLYHRMTSEGLQPQISTICSILVVCSLEEGKAIHSQAADSWIESHVTLGTALINMYAKCGSLDDARNVFNKMLRMDVVSWSAMVTAYAQHGHSEVATELFHQMNVEGVNPDDVMFACVLHACSHAGLLDDGSQLFRYMREDHGITATMEHYHCMIDLLARTGWLAQAQELIYSMPFEPDSLSWMTFLNGCKIHGGVQQGTRAGKHMFDLGSQNAAPYILLSNVYAAGDSNHQNVT